MKKFSFLLIFFIKVFAHEFVLIIPLYNEENLQRCQEYLTCLQKNINHESIKKVHVIYDTSKDCDTSVIFDFLTENEIRTTLINGRPTYKFCFDLANEIYPNEKIILANADIYFNETLHCLESYNLSNKFLILTRWDVKEDGSLQPHLDQKGKPAMSSHDVWIFYTPLREFVKASFRLGVPQCDVQIARQAKKAGLRVINPCLSIQACHLHLSAVCNYRGMSEGRFAFLGAKVSWSKL